MNDISSQRRIKSGDISAFEMVFKEYFAPLTLFANRYVKDKDTAEEIVQDFFYHYWKNRESMTIRISMKAYFYMAIRNNSLNYLRNMAVRQKYAETVISESTTEEVVSQWSDFEVRELQATINEILDELPERCRTIFRMNRFEGMKYREIAEKLSISIKTVEANMGKALQVLRKKLKKYQDQKY